MIWRKNTQVSKVLNIQIRVLSVWSGSKTNTQLLIINHKTQSLALQDIENTQKQQPWHKNKKSVQRMGSARNQYTIIILWESIILRTHSSHSTDIGNWHTTYQSFFCTSHRPVKVHQKVRKLATKWPKWTKIGPNFFFAKKYTTVSAGGADWYEVWTLELVSYTLIVANYFNHYYDFATVFISFD